MTFTTITKKKNIKNKNVCRDNNSLDWVLLGSLLSLCISSLILYPQVNINYSLPIPPRRSGTMVS